MSKAGWPLIDTDAQAARRQSAWVWITAGFLGSMLPPLLGLLIGMPLQLSGLREEPPFRMFRDIATILLASGFFGWVGMIPGLFIARLVALRGLAGWGVALSLGVLLPPLFATALSLDPRGFVPFLTFLGTIGAFYAGSFWIVLRALAPSIFARRD